MTQKLLGRLCEQNRILKDHEAVVHRLRMDKVHIFPSQYYTVCLRNVLYYKANQSCAVLIKAMKLSMILTPLPTTFVRICSSEGNP